MAKPELPKALSSVDIAIIPHLFENTIFLPPCLNIKYVDDLENQGIAVHGVLPGSPAADVFLPGDTIVSVNHDPFYLSPEFAPSLLLRLLRDNPRSLFLVRRYQNGQKKEFEASLPFQTPAFEHLEEEINPVKENGELGFQPTEVLAQKTGLVFGYHGLLVLEAKPGSLAFMAGLRQGDGVTHINGIDLTQFEDRSPDTFLQSLLAALNKKQEEGVHATYLTFVVHNKQDPIAISLNHLKDQKLGARFEWVPAREKCFSPVPLDWEKDFINRYKKEKDRFKPSIYEEKKYFDFSLDRFLGHPGILLWAVPQNSPAAKAGLKPFDIILARKTIHKGEEVWENLAALTPDERKNLFLAHAPEDGKEELLMVQRGQELIFLHFKTNPLAMGTGVSASYRYLFRFSIIASFQKKPDEKTQQEKSVKTTPDFDGQFIPYFAAYKKWTESKKPYWYFFKDRAELVHLWPTLKQREEVIFLDFSRGEVPLRMTLPHGLEKKPPKTPVMGFELPLPLPGILEFSDKGITWTQTPLPPYPDIALQGGFMFSNPSCQITLTAITRMAQAIFKMPNVGLSSTFLFPITQTDKRVWRLGPGMEAWGFLDFHQPEGHEGGLNRLGGELRASLALGYEQIRDDDRLDGDPNHVIFKLGLGWRGAHHLMPRESCADLREEGRGGIRCGFLTNESALVLDGGVLLFWDFFDQSP